MTSSADGRTRSSNWNLPNAITVVRILLAPIFFWMLLADDGQGGGLRWIGAWCGVLSPAGLLLYVGIALWTIRRARAGKPVPGALPRP